MYDIFVVMAYIFIASLFYIISWNILSWKFQWRLVERIVRGKYFLRGIVVILAIILLFGTIQEVVNYVQLLCHLLDRFNDLHKNCKFKILGAFNKSSTIFCISIESVIPYVIDALTNDLINDIWYSIKTVNIWITISIELRSS